MFSLSELTPCPNWEGGCFKLLKPWWEVFMEYLVVLMLMVSVLAGTLVLSRDGVVCLPFDPHHHPGPSPNHSSPRLLPEPPHPNPHPHPHPAPDHHPAPNPHPHHHPAPDPHPHPHPAPDPRPHRHPAPDPHPHRHPAPDHHHRRPHPAGHDRDHASRLPPPPPLPHVPQNAAAPPNQAPPLRPAPPPRPPLPTGRRTHLDYQQYVFVAQVCYHEALPWFSRFFPYLALLQSLALLAGGCFWFRFPRTSARIEHFLVILGKCCESPWTSRALSLAARLDGARGRAEGEGEGEEGGGGGDGTANAGGGGAGPKPSPLPPPPPATTSSPPVSRSPSIAGQSSLDSGTDSPLLVRRGSASAPDPVAAPSPCPSALSRSSSLSSGSFSASPPSPPQPASPARDGAPQTSRLGRSDGEQARALFERVRRFRAHCESSDIIYKVYLAQTVFKVLQFVLIVSYTAPLLSTVSFSHVCEPRARALTGYSAFLCTHSLASALRKLMLAYLGLLLLFGLLGLYSLCWICHRSLRQYSFQRVWDSSLQDVPDLSNDLAFLLHMADQYDPLLSRRLAVFLSPVSETRLLEESLERRWDAERLRAAVTSDPRGHAQLQLVALPRLPRALFSLAQLEVLKLELIGNAKLPAQVSHMTSLRELHLYHCPAAVEPGALAVLQERLEVLHLTFGTASEIPGWVYALRGLQELHLSGRVGGEGAARGLAGGVGGGGGAGRGWALGSLRQLRHLRALILRGALLQRVPGELAEVSASLLRLEVHNEGARLLALTGLRRAAGLAELGLQGCQLECLPSALLALGGLRALDLSHNALRTLEGLLGLQHLRRLASLRLAHNRVLSLPASVGMLRALELLDLGHNRLQRLPPALFLLPRLRCLLLAANLLEDLPDEAAQLGQLVELDLSGNKLEALPAAMPARLRTLDLSHNSLGRLPAGLGALDELGRLDVRGNSLEALPVELAACVGLRGGGLLAEDWLLLSLPPHVREALRRPDAAVAAATEARSRPNSRPDSRPNSRPDFCPDSRPDSRPNSRPNSRSDSRPDSDSFPTFSATQWSFQSALESRI